MISLNHELYIIVTKMHWILFMVLFEISNINWFELANLNLLLDIYDPKLNIYTKTHIELHNGIEICSRQREFNIYYIQHFRDKKPTQGICRLNY